MDEQNSMSNGYLIVQAFKAGMGLPVEGAKITVKNEEGGDIERILETDRNGQTEKIVLSTPPIGNSLSPSNTDNFSKYTVQTEIEGYYPVENLQVPVFAERVTLQQVNLIPLPLGYIAQPQTINDKEPEI